MLQIHEPVTRWLTIAYVSGLVLVASLAVGVYTLLTSVATEQTAIVEAINVAGSQRTFAMRIALLASELRNGDGMVRAAAAGRRVADGCGAAFPGPRQ